MRTLSTRELRVLKAISFDVEGHISWHILMSKIAPEPGPWYLDTFHIAPPERELHNVSELPSCILVPNKVQQGCGWAKNYYSLESDFIMFGKLHLS